MIQLALAAAILLGTMYAIGWTIAKWHEWHDNDD